jgi:hypothetical protein
VTSSSVLQEWDKIWTINKKLIDPVCPRHTAVVTEGRVPVTIEGELSRAVMRQWGGGCSCVAAGRRWCCPRAHRPTPRGAPPATGAPSSPEASDAPRNKKNAELGSKKVMKLDKV